MTYGRYEVRRWWCDSHGNVTSMRADGLPTDFGEPDGYGVYVWRADGTQMHICDTTEAYARWIASALHLMDTTERSEQPWDTTSF